MSATTASASSSSPQAFAAAQRKAPSKSWYNRCQEFVRTALGLGPGSGSAEAAYETAKARGAIHTDRNPPPNVPVYWDTGKQWGHTALSAGTIDGTPYVWSTDIERRGQVDLVPLSEVEQKWGARYLGWGSYLNGHTLSAANAAGSAAGTDQGGVVPAALRSHGPFDPIPGLNQLDDLRDIPGVPGQGGVADTTRDIAKGAVGLAGDGIAAGGSWVNSNILEPAWGRLGNFFTKAGFVVLGLGLVGLGINRMSQSPSAAGQAVAATGSGAKKVASLPARAGAAAATDGASEALRKTQKSKKAAPKPAAAAPTTPRARADRPGAAPRPRPTTTDTPPF